MHIKNFATCALISAGLVHSLQGHLNGSDNPNPGETIATYIETHITNVIEEAQQVINSTIDSKASARHNSTAEIHGRDNGFVSLGSSLYRPSSKDYSATLNDSGIGYNFTLPGCTPADTVVGDWLSPSGDLIENCTLAQMYQKLNLPRATLSNFTFNSIQNLLAKLNQTLHTDICNAPPAIPDRELLADPKYNPALQSGYWTGTIITGLGFISIAFTGLAAGILPRDAGWTTPMEEVVTLATFATLSTMFVVLAIDAREKRRFGRIEALILNAVVAASENTMGAGRRVSSCLSLSALQDGIQSVAEAVNERAGVLYIGPNGQTPALGTAGSSSINLVSHGDIENQNRQCMP